MRRLAPSYLLLGVLFFSPPVALRLLLALLPLALGLLVPVPDFPLLALLREEPDLEDEELRVAMVCSLDRLGEGRLCHAARLPNLGGPGAEPVGSHRACA
jgi:hypothetical protein